LVGKALHFPSGTIEFTISINQRETPRPGRGVPRKSTNMKRHSLVIAIVTALAAPWAHAQTSNVTLYGLLNMDVEAISKPDSKGISFTQVSSNTSRLGVRGTETLGGGLNAIFQIESGVSADVGGGTLASRDTYVGLRGNWGTARLGFMLTPYDQLKSIFGNAPTFDTSILSIKALWGQAGANRAAGCFGCRQGNSIRYDTPGWNGLSGSVQYSTNEQTNHGFMLSIGTFYKNAGFDFGATYETNRKLRAYSNTATGIGPQDLNDQAFTATGAYDFGAARVGLVYEHLEYEIGGSAGGAYRQDTLKRDYYGASLTVPVGTGTAFAYYGYAGKGKGAPDGTRHGDLVAGNDTQAAQYEITYTYPLSKRTSVYAGYVYINNGANAPYTFATNGIRTSGVSNTTPGVDQQGVILGLFHRF
jgi:predicted porin